MRQLVFAIGLGGLLAAGACSDDESVFNAEVGECIERFSDLAENVSELPETDCAEDHEGEVFFLVQHEGDDDEYPGQAELQAEAAEECEGEAFEDYVGVAYEETAIAVQYITPSEESWGQGDRETICVLGLPGGEIVDQSFEGNGEEFPLTQDFSSLVESCQGGDMAACDELYRTTPPGSEEERIAATCGGRSEEELPNGCEATFG